jgi:GntR family transcriptional regulator
MFFAIDTANGIAVYEQIVRQVKFAVAREAVKPGEMVPSVRELARELAVNPNTVARAYRQLQSDGVLESVRGTGLEVAARARDRCRRETVELIRARLRQVLVEARQSQLSVAQLQQLVEEELKVVSKPLTPSAEKGR